MKTLRTAIPLLLALALLGLSYLDFQRTVQVRVEPPLIALGSGKLASGGHCSGR